MSCNACCIGGTINRSGGFTLFCLNGEEEPGWLVRAAIEQCPQMEEGTLSDVQIFSLCCANWIPCCSMVQDRYRLATSGNQRWLDAGTHAVQKVFQSDAVALHDKQRLLFEQVGVRLYR